MSKDSQIIQLENYQQLLTQIQNVIAAAQNQINQQKVESAWQIGKLIDGHLQKHQEEKYGKYLITKLESDLNIAKSSIYRMRSFYQTYPQKPQETNALNWSHYAILTTIKSEEKRHQLETSTKEEKLSVRQLREKAKKVNCNRSHPDSFRHPEPVEGHPSTIEGQKKPSRLTTSRGQLYSYPILTIDEEPHIDLGFKIYRKVEEKIPSNVLAELKKGNALVETIKEENNYKLKTSDIKSAKKINIYQAKLQRVVDGDTIRVTLDLGFKIKHQEILRLRGINAAELSSEKGKLAKKELEKILAKIPYLIIKTTSTDIYGRFIADVFLAEAENEKEKKDGKKNEEKLTDPQKTANEGEYLNQILLDLGLAVRYM